MSTETDRLLIQRVRENPKRSRAYEEAWNELFTRYRGRLAAYVRRRLKDQAAVDDVVQETFVGLCRTLCANLELRGNSPAVGKGQPSIRLAAS